MGTNTRCTAARLCRGSSGRRRRHVRVFSVATVQVVAGRLAELSVVGVVLVFSLVAELCVFSFLFAQIRQPLARSFVVVLPRETVFGIIHAGVVIVIAVAIVEIAGRSAVILDLGDSR